jgi:hypothetical protein
MYIIIKEVNIIREKINIFENEFQKAILRVNLGFEDDRRK